MTCFSKKEIDIIRQMMFVGLTASGVDIYMEKTKTDKQYREGNKILYKLGFVGINKDGTDKEDDEWMDDYKPF